MVEKKHVAYCTFLNNYVQISISLWCYTRIYINRKEDKLFRISWDEIP